MTTNKMLDCIKSFLAPYLLGVDAQAADAMVDRVKIAHAEVVAAKISVDEQLATEKEVNKCLRAEGQHQRAQLIRQSYKLTMLGSIPTPSTSTPERPGPFIPKLEMIRPPLLDALVYWQTSAAEWAKNARYWSDKYGALLEKQAQPSGKLRPKDWSVPGGDYKHETWCCQECRHINVVPASICAKCRLKVSVTAVCKTCNGVGKTYEQGAGDYSTSQPCAHCNGCGVRGEQ